jgi:hypothetical protein
MPDWVQIEKFITTVGLPTALVVFGILTFVWYVVRPFSENFLGADGWIAKWFNESVETQKCTRDVQAKTTLILEGHSNMLKQIDEKVGGFRCYGVPTIPFPGGHPPHSPKAA